MAQEGQSPQELQDAAAGLIDTKGLIEDPKPPEGGDTTPKGDPAGKPTQPAADADPKPDTKKEPVGNIKLDTAFGETKFGEDNDKPLSSFEDVQAFAKETGIELKEVNDLRNVLSSYVELQHKVQNTPELEKTLNAFKAELESLPPQVAAIYNEAVSGGDYQGLIKQIASGTETDYTKHFKDHDVLSLVNKYSGRSFTKEQFDELDGANKDALLAVTESRYTSEQKAYQDQVLNYQKNQEAQTAKFSNSVKSAIEVLKKQFPSMKEDALRHVEAIMSRDLKESLFNPDNTYKPDAAVKIAMQEFGQQALEASTKTIGDLANKMRNQIASETHETIVNRNDAPISQGRQIPKGSENVIEKAADEATSFLYKR